MLFCVAGYFSGHAFPGPVLYDDFAALGGSVFCHIRKVSGPAGTGFPLLEILFRPFRGIWAAWCMFLMMFISIGIWYLKHEDVYA